jgi:hypothetical protein
VFHGVDRKAWIGSHGKIIERSRTCQFVVNLMLDEISVSAGKDDANTTLYELAIRTSRGAPSVMSGVTLIPALR